MDIYQNIQPHKGLGRYLTLPLHNHNKIKQEEWEIRRCNSLVGGKHKNNCQLGKYLIVSIFYLNIDLNHEISFLYIVYCLFIVSIVKDGSIMHLLVAQKLRPIKRLLRKILLDSITACRRKLLLCAVLWTEVHVPEKQRVEIVVLKMQRFPGKKLLNIAKLQKCDFVIHKKKLTNVVEKDAHLMLN